MKNAIIILLTVWLLTGHATAQSIPLEVTATGGGLFSNNLAKLDWTLGEPVVETFAGNVVLSQGFHQTFDFATPVYENPLTGTLVKVYPNPAAGWLAIEMKSPVPRRAVLTDLYGRILLTAIFKNQTEKLDITDFPSGTYLLTFYGEDGLVQSFKIQKVR